MATFQFDLVSPEKLLLSGEVEQVDVPGAEGDFGVLAGHAPMVAALRPGILTIRRDGGEIRIVILGGFAEVSPAGLTILADSAAAVEDFDRALLAEHIKAAEEKVAKMSASDAIDKEITRLDHFRSLNYHLEGTAMH
ncbi:MAG: F0F1 ATP synthase subunit epsilon [Pseudorhodoplanes sp.]|uniref:F0F1 ATP synthase subunit epsilon n=1 Tax=Pseudorhodoplanes sp. TaxID=1934341 RepID=UPI003D119799